LQVLVFVAVFWGLRRNRGVLARQDEKIASGDLSRVAAGLAALGRTVELLARLTLDLFAAGKADDGDGAVRREGTDGS
jgi:hypothetical protein